MSLDDYIAKPIDNLNHPNTKGTNTIQLNTKQDAFTAFQYPCQYNIHVKNRCKTIALRTQPVTDLPPPNR